jgi:intracellular septation protein
VIVLVFGTLTLVLHNETFIKVKPTIIYSTFGVILAGGLVFNRSLIAVMFDQMFNLTPHGWRLLTIRWAVFFFAMAILNEVIWRTQTTDFWVAFKAFGVMPITAIFAMIQFPLINRHAQPPAPADAADTERGNLKEG